jgi:hypothetical protein
VWLHLSTSRPAITFACHWVGCASSTYPLALSSHPRLPAHPRGGTSLDALNPTLNSIRHQGERHHAPIPPPLSPSCFLLGVFVDADCACVASPLPPPPPVTSPSLTSVLGGYQWAFSRILACNGLLEMGTRAPVLLPPRLRCRCVSCCVCAFGFSFSPPLLSSPPAHTVAHRSTPSTRRSTLSDTNVRRAHTCPSLPPLSSSWLLFAVRVC